MNFLQKIQYEVILKSPQSGTYQKRKFSADYKKRNRYDRSKQKQAMSPMIPQYQSEDLPKKQQKAGQKMFQIKKSSQFSKMQGKQSSFISKKMSPVSLGKTRNYNNQKQFSHIMQNISEFLKKSENRQKIKKQQKKQMQVNFYCLRAKIHQQYNFPKESDFNYDIPPETINKLKRQTMNELKNICNPFIATKTVTCNRVELHTAQKPKDPNNSTNNISKLRTQSINRLQMLKTSSAKKRILVCHDLTVDSDNNYVKKVKNYMQFLFKVNFSNHIYVRLNLQRSEDSGSGSFGGKYKMFVGKGNNCLLVKSIMKRKFWWQFTNNIEDNNIDFYWSQNTLDKVHQMQKKSVTLIPQSQMSRRTIRIRQKIVREQDRLNRKILNQERCSQVESFIVKEGFILPYQQEFIPDVLSNHIPRNNAIGSKKNLFKSLYHYYKHVLDKNPFEIIPQTYHVTSREADSFKKFVEENSGQPKKVWIVKPGENSNRGNSIFLAQFSEVDQLVTKAKHKNGQELTYIIQSYINRPFLYNNRKFDIRHYMLLTSINGVFKAYWYKEGYIRTSSEIFDLENLANSYIHLTNDAVQKHSENFSKYQPSNKLSYNEFQRYLEYTYPSKSYNFQKDILMKMKEISLDIIKANYLVMDHKRSKNNFQIFGLDFMIDRDFKPWLIEVNFNPCLQINCPVLERIIPSMLQNSFRIALDPLFPPTSHFPPSKRFYLSDNYLKNLKYQLIFDSLTLKEEIKNNFMFEDNKEMEQEYQDQGTEVVIMDI